MAVSVGRTCGVAVQLVLDGQIKQKGVFAPYTRDVVDPLLAALEAEGFYKMVEKVQ